MMNGVVYGSTRHVRFDRLWRVLDHVDMHITVYYN